MDKMLAEQIREGYHQVDKSWLNLHYRTALALFFVTILVEGAFCYFLSQTPLVSISILRFYLKYWVVPGGVNLLCVLLQTGVMRAKWLSQKTKIYLISLTFVFLCFVLFTVHIVFAVVYFIFVVPMVLTVVYADYRLTTVTAVLSIASALCSELFIEWDPSKVSIWGNTLEMMEFLIGMAGLISFYAVCMVVILFERRKNADSMLRDIERRRLERRLQIDELTGVYNRNALHAAFRQMERQADGHYIFVMLDMDNFKVINDTQGHVAGDRYLAALGEILMKNCVEGVPYRYGGDEFSILFEGCRMKNVTRICGQIQKDLGAVDVEAGDDFTLTVSIGIAEYQKGMDIGALVPNADKALYEAKSVRNTIRIY